jgi:Fe-S-cluster containining protein
MREAMRVGDLISANCAACREPDCCQLNGSPFFLTEYDVSRIHQGTGLDCEGFSFEKGVNQERYYSLQTKADGTCIFYDKDTVGNQRCKIYPHRPLDCRLYPFTVELIAGECWWVQYLSCGGRYLNRDIEDLLEHLEVSVVPLFSRKEILGYATADSDAVVALPRQVLRKVQFRANGG